MNVKKSSLLMFNFSSSLSFEPVVEIGGEALSLVSHTRILGITISENLKWNEHINIVTKKARSRVYLLIKMMSNGFDHELILDVYTKEIRSILEYGCVVFHHGLSSELERQLESV